MKTKGLIVGACILATGMFVACDKNDFDELNQMDRTFLTNTSLSNTAEVTAGTLAATKATNPVVKAFAQQMVMEHTVAQNDLKMVADSVGHPVQDSLDSRHTALMTQLNSVSGRAFDSIYMHTQRTDHQLTVALFQTERDNGRHAAVRDYANTYFQYTETHYTRADSITRAFYRR